MSATLKRFRQDRSNFTQNYLSLYIEICIHTHVDEENIMKFYQMFNLDIYIHTVIILFFKVSKFENFKNKKLKKLKSQQIKILSS